MKAKIIGVGSSVPENVVTNDDLSKKVDTNDEWIQARTGIKERRVSDDKTATSDLALKAAQKALTNAKLDASELDLIIVGTTSPDYLFPSVATLLAGKLGATKAAGFDVSAACSGFNFALTTATKYIESGSHKNVLVIGADTLTKYLDWTDRGTCILFGDGAGAVVLTESTDDSGILASWLKVESDQQGLLTMPGGGSRDPEQKNGRFIRMEGKEVFKFAVRVLEESIGKVLELANLKVEDIDLLIPHQANARIVDHVKKKLKLGDDNVFKNLEKYGNTSAASIPLALDEALAAGRIKKGDIVIISGFGAGLTCGANLIRW
ncbi:MAG: beta-ketoacyl-ACP synthase III [bacterium]